MATNWKEVDPEKMAQTLEWLEGNLLNDSEVGPQVKRILHKKGAHFPEVDLEDRISTKEKELDERISNFEKTQKDKENKTYWEGERKKAREQYDLNDEDVTAVEKYMIDNHVGNYQIAARDYANFVKAPAEPSNYQERTGIQIPTMDGLMKDPAGWATNEAFKALNELQREQNRR